MGDRKQLLIAEDEPTIRLLYANQLGKEYALTLATCLQDAAEKLAERRPDMLITDNNLGDGSGLTLGIKASELYAGLPWIIITSDAGKPGFCAQALNAGAKAVFDKPTDWDALKAFLRAALGGA